MDHVAVRYTMHTRDIMDELNYILYNLAQGLQKSWSSWGSDKITKYCEASPDGVLFLSLSVQMLHRSPNYTEKKCSGNARLVTTRQNETEKEIKIEKGGMKWGIKQVKEMQLLKGLVEKLKVQKDSQKIVEGHDATTYHTLLGI